MKTLVAVAMGDAYVQGTEAMIQTFRQHNQDWSVARFYNQDLVDIIPKEFLGWSDQAKCEIGRWCAMRQMLKTSADHVLYCDGDFMWLGQHVSNVKAPLIFTPHQITPEARWKDFGRRMGDGIVNLGMIEAYRDADDLMEAIIKLVITDAKRWIRKGKLWLQFPMDAVMLAGYKTAMNTYPGTNIARWNIGYDRSIIGSVDKPVVRFKDWDWPASSLHMSGYGHMKGRTGPVMEALIARYEALRR